MTFLSHIITNSGSIGNPEFSYETVGSKYSRFEESCYFVQGLNAMDKQDRETLERAKRRWAQHHVPGYRVFECALDVERMTLQLGRRAKNNLRAVFVICQVGVTPAEQMAYAMLGTPEERVRQFVDEFNHKEST